LAAKDDSVVYDGNYAGGLHKSTDGGATWGAAGATRATGDVVVAAAPGTDNGWILGNGGTNLTRKSADQGATRTTSAGIGARAHPSDIKIVSSTVGWAGGDANHAIRTTDGTNWALTPTNLPCGPIDVDATDANHAWVWCGVAQVVYTSDGGTTWN